MIFTDEQREAGREKRKQLRKWADENLKVSYSDDDYWKELSKEADFRLPQKHIAASETRYIKRLMKHLKLDEAWFQEYSGCRTIKELVKMNPETTSRAMCGQFLEAWKEIKEKK